MKYDVTICITYCIDDASDKWDAIEQAERMFACDTHPSYDIDINPVCDDEDIEEDLDWMQRQWNLEAEELNN